MMYFDDPRPATERVNMSAEVIADTVGKFNGVRLTTMALTYPRYIHSQMMTHRVFSRNAQSSRAVPVQKMIDRVSDQPVTPTRWGLNQRGMVAAGDADEVRKGRALATWHDACDAAVDAAQRLVELGIHKQVANRLLEPFATITAIYTATEWDNFFRLRVAHDAQPEIQSLAEMMQTVMSLSDPKVAEFHIPYINREESHGNSMHYLSRLSTARCARISYLTHDGARDPLRDESLADELESDGHWSPFEHQARNEHNKGFRANLRGWASTRYLKGF